jgi:hypothetical protein
MIATREESEFSGLRPPVSGSKPQVGVLDCAPTGTGNIE